jgi:hypothetical protein
MEHGGKKGKMLFLLSSVFLLVRDIRHITRKS